MAIAAPELEKTPFQPQAGALMLRKTFYKKPDSLVWEPDTTSVFYYPKVGKPGARWPTRQIAEISTGPGDEAITIGSHLKTTTDEATATSVVETPDFEGTGRRKIERVPASEHDLEDAARTVAKHCREIYGDDAQREYDDWFRQATNPKEFCEPRRLKAAYEKVRTGFFGI